MEFVIDTWVLGRVADSEEEESLLLSEFYANGHILVLDFEGKIISQYQNQLNRSRNAKNWFSKISRIDGRIEYYTNEMDERFVVEILAISRGIRTDLEFIGTALKVYHCEERSDEAILSSL